MSRAKVIDKVWSELLAVPYVSSQPGIKFGFATPKQKRADTNPLLNNQPWYEGATFNQVDPTRTIVPPVRK